MSADRLSLIADMLADRWALVEPTPFPDEHEHREVCDRLGLRSSDPMTWSPEYRRRLNADLQHRLSVACERLASVGPHSKSRYD